MAELTMSEGQRKRLAKIERMRGYFGPEDRPEIYEWDPDRDEAIDFDSMTDAEIAAYLKPQD